MILPKIRFDQLFSILLIVMFSLARIDLPATTNTIDLLALLTPPPVSAQVTVPTIIESPLDPPLLSAQSALVYDPQNGVFIFEKNAQQALPIASLTKIMTALVASELYDPHEVVTINGEEHTEGNTIKLQKGESITVENLLHGLLIFSGNDAAYALANHHPTGLPGFIDEMNKKAQELHLFQTSFENPAGFDTANQFSSSYDLAILMKEVSKHPTLLQIMGTEFAEIQSVDGKFSHAVYNTNELLKKMEEVYAGKTGSTPMAKECLITLTTKNDHPIITVVLGSENRFEETEQLIDWTYDTFTWTTIDFKE